MKIVIVIFRKVRRQALGGACDLKQCLAPLSRRWHGRPMNLTQLGLHRCQFGGSQFW